MYLLKLKYDRLIIMQKELQLKKEFNNSKETKEEKVLRRKYEKRIIGKNI
jgi:hypothetical protein